MRIATFRFRSIPLRPGCAGADKFAIELFPRLVARGHSVVAYNRLFKGEEPLGDEYKGVQYEASTRPRARRASTRSCTRSSVLGHHSQRYRRRRPHAERRQQPLRAAAADVRQEGVPEPGRRRLEAAEWPWYGRLYLWMTQYLTAFAPHAVIFDNVFCKAEFE